MNHDSTHETFTQQDEHVQIKANETPRPSHIKETGQKVSTALRRDKWLQPVVQRSPRTPPRLLHVLSTLQLSPAMRRITLGGPALHGFPSNSNGRHIKLMLPRQNQIVPALPTLGPNGPIWPPPQLRPITRTYTVAQYDEKAATLAVDFVLHGDHGPASRWATHAQPEDAIGIAGPGGPTLFQDSADWFLLIGDPSSLPLLKAVLAALPRHAQGQVLVEIPNLTEIQTLQAPPAMPVRWFNRNGQSASQSHLLIDAVMTLNWLAGQPSITLAGENAQVITIRNFLLQRRGLSRQQLYAVPYWKDQHNEEAYHEERHRLMDELEHTLDHTTDSDS